MQPPGADQLQFGPRNGGMRVAASGLEETMISFAQGVPRFGRRLRYGFVLFLVDSSF
jgi:hypothetical protein